MAVGIIVGGAFTSIVSSLVDDLLMPLIGTLLVGINGKCPEMGGRRAKKIRRDAPTDGLRFIFLLVPSTDPGSR